MADQQTQAQDHTARVAVSSVANPKRTRLSAPAPSAPVQTGNAA